MSLVLDEPSLYGTALHDDPATLAPLVRRFHLSTEPVSGVGIFRIERPSTWLARAIGALLRFPRAGERTPVVLDIERHGSTETWRRRFGQRPLVSRQHMVGRHLIERVGPIEIVLGLHVEDGALMLTSRAVRVAIGRLRLVLPAVLSLDIKACVHDSDDGLRVVVEVDIASTLLGPLLRYTGELTMVVES